MTFIIKDKKKCRKCSKYIVATMLAVESNVDENEITFKLQQYTCVDMTRAIKVAQSINPNVNKVYTFSGDKVDACYSNVNGKWEAMILEFKQEHMSITLGSSD